MNFSFKKMRGCVFRHEEWISSFWVNVAATVLGIVLTFGVTEWLEKLEERRNAEVLVERSFKNIQIRLKDLDRSITTLNEQDSLLILCVNDLPNGLVNVPTSDLISLINLMGVRWHFFESKSVEIGFKQDINSQKILGPFADVLGDAFEILNYAESINDGVNNHKQKFYHSYYKYWSADGLTISREQCIELLTETESIYCLDQVSCGAQSLRNASRYLNAYIEVAYALWLGKIEYEDFERWMEEHDVIL